MHNYNNPLHAVQQFRYHTHLFKLQMLSTWQNSRWKVIGSLVALSLAIPGTQALVRRTIPAEGALRPAIQTILYGLFTSGAGALTYVLYERKQGDIGWKNLLRTEVESLSDAIEAQSERKFIPFSNSAETIVVREQVNDEPQQLTTVQEPIVIPVKEGEEPYQAPPVLNRTDLSRSISETKLPVMIIGSTGTGKTYLLMNVVGELIEREQEVWVFDGKPKKGSFDKFGNRIHYVPLAQTEDVPNFVAKLKEVCNIMQDAERDESSPRITVMLDEINNAITKAELYVLESGSKKKEPSLIDSYSKLLLSQGRQKNVIPIGTSHEANASTIGGSTGMRTNYRFAILGSPMGTENIEHILNGVIKLIPFDNEREQLKVKYRMIKEGLSDEYYALSNTLGSWRFMS